MDEIENVNSPDENALVDLIERAQQNFDPEAFDGLYLLFADRVFRYLLARLGDAETAEEVTAQVFVRLIEKIHLYRIGPKDNVTVFSAWLYRMAHNKMVDVVRAHKRAHQVALEHARQVAFSVSLGIVDARLELEEILQKLQCLSDPRRDVIVLRFIEELSIAETAQIMQKSEAAVKALQQRALENLRRYLNL